MPAITLPTPWQERFASERTRLLAALGELTDGGIVEALQPIGSISFENENKANVPENAQTRLDIGLAVWPFPLPAREQAALEAMGYAPIPGYEAAPEQRFRHDTLSFQLFLVDAGSEKWTDWLVLRDYLRANGEARNSYFAVKRDIEKRRYFDVEGITRAKAGLFAETLQAAQQWWIETKGFAPLHEVAQELKGFAGAWHIAGGWAIDCFLSRVTRVHHDIDILIARSDQIAIQEYMRGQHWKWVTPHEGKLEPWPPHTFLELPRHQAHAHRNGQMRDFLFGEVHSGVWKFRRDPNILRTTERIFLRADSGLPYLAPEVALLYKSRSGQSGMRDRDQADFDKTHPHLNPEQRAWLRWTLIVTNPEHPWLSTLA